jgi:hypothetical protein
MKKREDVFYWILNFLSIPKIAIKLLFISDPDRLMRHVMFFNEGLSYSAFNSLPAQIILKLYSWRIYYLYGDIIKKMSDEELEVFIARFKK